MKTNELTGAALDWAVAKCEGYDCLFDDEVSGAWLVPQQGYLHDEKPLSRFSPSTNWAQGGPIIEREQINIGTVGISTWRAGLTNEDGKSFWADGPTPLIAAMRCLVASKLGDEVELPDGL